MDEQKSDELSTPNQHIVDENHHAVTRRHGEILETAILQAAWDELNEVGYAHLTMEGVALRAKTNKAAIYRRWPNKPKIVVAALSKHVPRPANEIPNTGNLRNDLLILLGSITELLQTIGGQTIHGLMVEYFGKELISTIPQIMHPEEESKWTTVMMTILKNAEMRGEISLEKVSPRVVSLPADLLRFELLTTHEPVSDKTISEIVDDIFLPLVYL